MSRQSTISRSSGRDFDRIHRILVGTVCAFLVCFAALNVPAGAADKPKPVSIGELTKKAMGHERAGQALEAAKVYEEIARRDPTRKRVVAGRLVKIYATGGVPKKALSWAKVVMETNPQPQAYLAGVYTMLKDHEAARKILEEALEKADETVKKLTLMWQLAGVYEALDQFDKAEARLRAAVELAKGTNHEKAAKKQLDVFLQKREAENKNE